MSITRSGRTIKQPIRFAEMTFVPGSRIAGCDHFDNGYNCGVFYGTYKDTHQKAQDVQYEKDLEKSMMVQETTQKLPDEMSREIQKFLTRRSHYKDDINFIAPDNVEPIKEINNDKEESEWESGDETSEDEWEEYE
jgi:hypothetical protein